ncbi:uncharacterized protein LOC132747678 [Ruditapes philippinarum]|uniref:uncharacterized protein LOC132747678 n=1 Tax=Ruditapes philippinarum TaxID=129788 RepID=UPI00295AB43C|nr:uncharacterized protein LOC132747678 [Ruditapes philippinarum]
MYLPNNICLQKCLPHSNYKDGPPSSWFYATSESEYMDGEIFFEWFVKCFIPNCGKERPVCLIMDNHDSHITLPLVEKAIENNIILIGLPAHTTHILQPLDVKIIGPLKNRFNTIAERCGFLSQGFTISKAKFPLLLSYAIDQTTPASVKDAFKTTGIYPLSVDAIDKSQLIPASFKQPVTENAGTAELKTCPTCGVFNVNPLLKDGLVPKSLADVLMPPPAKPLSQKRTSRMILEGRIISGDDMLMKLKEKEKALEEKKERQEERKRIRELKQEEKAKKEEKKTKRREEKSKKSARRDVSSQSEKRDRPSRLDNPMYTCTCGVCSVRGRVDDEARGIEWVGCDESMCLAWYHLDCLCTEEKEYIRESLSDGNDWYCKVCKPWLYMEE